MKTIAPAIKAAIREHAKEAMPNEACGFILTKNRKRFIRRATNVAAKPDRDWKIDGRELLDAEKEGTIVGIYHSHPYGRAVPTDADRTSCGKVRIPYVIAAFPIDEFFVIEPENYTPPLEGRDFVHGILDCYSLCRDYYKVTHGIELPDFERADDWWSKGQNLYLDNFDKAGFVVVGTDWKQAKVGDAFLMRLVSPTVNHAAIYVSPNAILHHVFNRFSRTEFLSQFWQDHVAFVVRHKALIK